MTNEEALKVLKYRSGWNLSIRDVNALDMAIKALEEEPCEDAISRKLAVSRISDLIVLELKGERLPTWNEVHNALGELPPVKPKPKMGHWIYERCDMYSCSVCHHWHTDLDEKMNYCPNCGARMVEPQESEVKE